MFNSPYLIFSLYLLTLVGLSRVYIYVAKRFKILDFPNERSSHSIAIIRGGGVLFYFAFLIFSIHSKFQHPYLFFGVTILAIVSFWDDISSLSAKQRLPIQAISLILITIEMSDIAPIIIIPLIIIGGVLAINCYNFIDGINGMLGLYSLSVFLLFGYLLFTEDVFPLELPVLILLAIVVFGYYNFRKKALFFSGDIGSMTLGILAFFLVCLTALKLESPLILLSLIIYITDTLGTIIKRIINGKNIFQAHREHLYEQLADNAKITHLQISACYAILQFILNIVVMVFYKSDLITQMMILFGIQFFLGITYWMFDHKLKRHRTSSI